MTAGDERSSVVRYWWSRALDSLASAGREADASSHIETM